MTHPPRIMLLLMLALVALASAACPMDVPPLPPGSYPTSTPTPPLKPAPKEILYPTEDEDPATVVDWARPLGPEGDYHVPTVTNFQFTPDGQTLLYVVRYPNSLWTLLYSSSLTGGKPILLATAKSEG